VGGIDTNFKRAGDYYLWTKFAEFSPLVSVSALLSCFRSVQGQISEDHEAYMKEVKALSPSDTLSSKVRWFSRFEKRLPKFIRGHVFRFLFGRLMFSTVVIGADGMMRKVKGEYHEVVNLL